MKSFWMALLAIAGSVGGGNILAASAEETYKKTCSICHDAGVGGAPKLGDKAAWAPRVKQGKEALYKVSIQGKPGTAMIAKGGNAQLSDAEVKAAVDYMLVKAR